jgi:hypothetical protein
LTAVFENYVAEIRLDGKAVQLALWDTAYVASIIPPYKFTLRMYIRGQEEYEVGFRFVNLRKDPERDSCLAFTTVVLFQVSCYPHCLCN